MLLTPDASPARRALERSSVTVLLWLHQQPRWLPPLILVALLVTGLAVGGWGGALALAGLAAVLAWLAALSWPRLSAQSRLLRVAAVALVVVASVARAVH